MERFKLLKNLTIRQLFILINWGTVALLILAAGILGYIIFLQYQHKKTIEKEHLSYQLIDELRQTSEDLTKFVRNYVINHNNKFEEYYNNIIAIRDGEKPRPENYHRIYWDFMIRSGIKPQPDSDSSISLYNIMENVGFTKAELAKIKESETNSVKLYTFEKTAINAVKEGLLKEKDTPQIIASENTAGENIDNENIASENINNEITDENQPAETDSIAEPEAEPENQINEEESKLTSITTTEEVEALYKKAIELVFDDNYHIEKAKVLKPLDECLEMVDTRTSEEIDQQQNKITNYLELLDIFFLLIILLNIGSYLVVKNKIIRPILAVKSNLILLSRGVLPKQKVSIENNDEISEISKALNIYVESLEKTAKFAAKIGTGELEVDFKPLSDEDELGNALLDMKDSLQKAATEEKKRKVEEQERNWTTQGVTKFGDILRQSTKNMKELAYNIISNLVNYLEANQGGLFLYNDDNKLEVFLELLAAYAYDRKKFLTKKILLKEGLVGTCAVEKKTIYLTKVPADYIEITSGLGDAPPRSLLIVPLKMEEEILGVIEIASFNTFTQNEILFVEKIAENIASTLSSVRINHRTAELLRQSQIQSEELASKEEEMRQNMEELQATQEEAARKEAEASGFVSAVNQTSIRADFSLDATLIYANHKFLELIGYEFHEIDGKHINYFLQENLKDEFEIEWQKLQRGNKHYVEEVNLKTKYGNTWVLATITGVSDRDGSNSKFLFLAVDISENKRQHDEVARLLEESRQKTKRLQEHDAAMKQNMEELEKAKQNLEIQKKEMEKVNLKLQDNENELRILLNKMEANERELRTKSQELQANEEELKANLEELQVTQEELLAQKKELEKSHHQMGENQKILQKAVMSSKEKEKLLQEKSQQLLASEEELRQNLEELQSTQEEINRQKTILEEANQRFNLINNGAGEGLWDMIIPEEGITSDTKLWVSERFVHSLGKTEFEPTLGNWQDLIHPQDLPSFKNALKNHIFDLTGKTELDTEFRLKIDHDDYHWFHTTGSTLRNEKGKPIRTAGSLRDVTLRHKKQQEINELISRFELISKGSNEGIWEVHIPENKIIIDETEFWWSTKFKALLGFEGEEFPNIAKSWITKIHPEDKITVIEAFNTHISDYTGRVPFDIELRIKNKANEYNWFRMYGDTLRNAQGKPIKTAGSLTNIQVQKDLIRIKEELEKEMSEKDKTFEEIIKAKDKEIEHLKKNKSK